MQNDVKITFQPSGRNVFVLPGTTLFEAAIRAGITLRGPCGGRGTCGKCGVRVRDGACPPTPQCRKFFSEDELAAGYRLACAARAGEDMVLDVPDDSVFRGSSRILTEGTEGAVGGTPTVSKRYVELPQPDEDDPMADAGRLARACGPFRTSLEILRELPSALREGGFKGTAVFNDGELIGFEGGNTAEALYGVAFDLGTTTLVGTLIDLCSGRELGVTASMNPQVSFGDDVISRITRAREEQSGVADMQIAVVARMNEMLGDLVVQAGIAPDAVYDISVAGNTTMQHLFCGISPAALGEVPFAPGVSDPVACRAAEVGLEAHPRAGLYVFPCIGGFVGGDTVAGILAHSLADAERPTMLVDIGTNGEIVLAANGRILASSTAAGPAFEGARITCGMRAAEGAIEKVVLEDGDILCNVIGNVPAAGICGTALIDAVAVLLDLGLLDMTGRLLPAEEAPEGIPDAVRKRLHEDDRGVNLLLASPEETGTGHPVYLYQRDIRELQLASGAIRAGVSIMLRRAGISVDDLDAVLLAGGFGNYIRRENARRIGLLPDMPVEKIRFVGNAASTGAKAALRSRECRADCLRIVAVSEHVDLSRDPEFQMEFGMAMMFPDENGMVF